MSENETENSISFIFVIHTIVYPKPDEGFSTRD